MSITTFLWFEIETLSPFLIADPERQGSPVDRPVHVDAEGNVFVPATSLAGSLRAHLERDAPDRVESVMGASAPEGTDEDQDGGDESEKKLTPSRLRLLGTDIKARDASIDATTDVDRQASTAIDRERGAAKSKTLRTSESVPAGAVITLYAEYDGLVDQAVLDHLAAWQPRLGGGKSTGNGRAKLRWFRHGTLDFAEPESLAVLFSHGGHGLVEHVATTPVKGTGERSGPLVDTEWTIVDSVHVGSGKVEDGNILCAYRRAHNGLADTFYVEGTSLKGVIRSRCEFIERTLRADDEAPRCEAIFGSIGAISQIEVRGTPFTDGQVMEQPHVAIDRFTGGAMPGALWSEEVVFGGKLRIVIDERTPGTLTAVDKALLFAALADLDAGYVGIGKGTGRGIGTIELADGSPRADEISGALPFSKDVLAELEATKETANV